MPATDRGSNAPASAEEGAGQQQAVDRMQEAVDQAARDRDDDAPGSAEEGARQQHVVDRMQEAVDEAAAQAEETH